MQRTEWFNRKFPVQEDNGVLPSIIERLRGTPVRVEAMVAHLDAALLQGQQGDKWSIKEEIGHLSDLEPLWFARLGELIEGVPELRAADLSNRQTHTANHNASEIQTLLQRFREHRVLLTDGLSGLNEAQLAHVSLHPRLKTPMRIIDLAYFVAEHDDHHLASIRELLR